MEMPMWGIPEGGEPFGKARSDLDWVDPGKKNNCPVTCKQQLSKYKQMPATGVCFFFCQVFAAPPKLQGTAAAPKIKLPIRQRLQTAAIKGERHPQTGRGISLIQRHIVVLGPFLGRTVIKLDVLITKHLSEDKPPGTCITAHAAVDDYLIVPAANCCGSQPA